MIDQATNTPRILKARSMLIRYCCTGMLMAALLSACSLSILTGDSDRDQELEETRIALAVQQTAMALQSGGGLSGTVAAQQAIIESQQTQQAMALLPPTANLPATMAEISARQTQLALGGAGVTQGAQPGAGVTQGPVAGPGFNPAEEALAMTQTAMAGGSGGAQTSGFYLYDHFNDHVTWPVGNYGSYSTSYYQSYYVISVTAPRYDAMVFTGRDYGQQGWVETEAEMTQGSNYDYYGVICRYQDANNYYFFTVRPDGYTAVGKRTNGVVKIFGQTYFESAVNQGLYSLNKIRGVCNGGVMHFYINGVDIIAHTDYDLSWGDVGLIVMSGDMGNVFVGFDYILADQ